MKFHHALSGFLVVLTLAFTGCGKSETEKAADEQAAVQQFKTEIAGVAASEPEKGILGKALGKVKAMAHLPAKLKAVKTEKLPPDLKVAFADFVAKLGKTEPLLAELGATPEERIRNLTTKPQAAQEFSRKFQALLPEIQPAGQKLIEVGRKYGIEKLSDIVPQ